MHDCTRNGTNEFLGYSELSQSVPCAQLTSILLEFSHQYFELVKFFQAADVFPSYYADSLLENLEVIGNLILFDGLHEVTDFMEVVVNQDDLFKQLVRLELKLFWVLHLQRQSDRAA